MTGTVPLSVPLFNSKRRLTALGAEGVQDMMARQLRTEASASEKSVARRFAVDRVANEARMAHGPVGGAQTADTGARPLSLSHESGGTRGAYGYDASKIHGIITIKHDEAKLRAAPFRRLAPGARRATPAATAPRPLSVRVSIRLDLEHSRHNARLAARNAAGTRRAADCR